MKVYRIASKKHAEDLSGTGAAIYGGRWNKKGSPVIYTGQSIEIALLETVVHTPPMLIPALQLVTLQIPAASITQILPAQLPPNWKDYPAPSVLAEIGDQWIAQNTTVALQVPSCIIPSVSNYILNPRHKDFAKVKVISHENFDFDPRLKK